MSRLLRKIELPLFSSLHRALAQPPYNKAALQTWMQWMIALEKKGISHLEWEYQRSIIEDCLNPESVFTEEKIRQFMLDDDPAAVEIVLREVAVRPTLSFFSFSRDIPTGDDPWNHPDRPKASWHYYNPVHDFRIVSQRNFSILGYTEDWMILNRHWQLWRYKKIRAPYFVSASEAKRWCDEVLKQIMPIKLGVRQPAKKWSRYVTEGGENYREWLFVLPHHRPLFECSEISTHFAVDNVVAHLRTTDRVLNGKPVLFLEEIQSDWNQMLRCCDAEIRPYYENAYRTQWVSLVLRAALLIALKEGKSGIAVANGEMNEARYGRVNPGLVHFYDVVVMKDFKKLAKALGASVESLFLNWSGDDAEVSAILPDGKSARMILLDGLPRLGAI